MPPAFNRATFYSTFVLMHNIADHFSPPNCPSHCNLSPKSDNNVLSTGEQGSEIFFFLIKVGYSADLFGICLRDSGSERGALFLSISRRFNRARNYRKSQHPSRRRQITRQLEPPDRAKPRRSWNSAKIYAWKRAKMDDRAWFRCSIVNYWPLSRSTILLSTLIAIMRGWIHPREWNHPLSNRCNYHSLVARIRGSIVADGFLGYKFY